jgi:hypothetical protein
MARIGVREGPDRERLFNRSSKNLYSVLYGTQRILIRYSATTQRFYLSQSTPLFATLLLSLICFDIRTAVNLNKAHINYRRHH